MVTDLRRSQAFATRRRRSRMSRVRCESGSSCEDDEAKTEDDGREGEAEIARGRRDRAQRRHVRRNSCSRSVVRATMQVVLLELDDTRAEQGDDVGRFKMADTSEKGFGERCSSRRDREMAGSVRRRPSRACAVVCWFRARVGYIRVQEPACVLGPIERKARARARGRAGGRASGRGRGKGSDWLGVGGATRAIKDRD